MRDRESEMSRNVYRLEDNCSKAGVDESAQLLTRNDIRGFSEKRERVISTKKYENANGRINWTAEMRGQSGS